MEQLHTPEEMQFLSNLGHWIEGGILGIVAVIAFVQALGYLKAKKYLWPGFILIAGLFLPPYMLLHHGLDKVGLSWNLITADSQQRQHLIMATLLFVAGLSEVLNIRGTLQTKVWKFIWPLVLIIIGVMFMVHTQHGTHEAVSWAITVHRYLGILLVLAGIFKAFEVLWIEKFKWFSILWIIFLFVSSVLLILYREPEGAYMHDTPSQHEQHIKSEEHNH